MWWKNGGGSEGWVRLREVYEEGRRVMGEQEEVEFAQEVIEE